MKSTCSTSRTGVPAVQVVSVLVLVALGILGVLHVAGWEVYRGVTGLPPLCFFKHLTGLDCPGCGMTRAMALLAEGRVSASLDMHPFAMAFLVLCLVGAVNPALLQRPSPGRQRVLVAGIAFLLGRWLLHLGGRVVHGGTGSW